MACFHNQTVKWKKYNWFALQGKHAERCYGKLLKGVSKILRGVTEKDWEMISKKYCKVFYKTTETCSAKILKGVQQKHWKVLCKNCWGKLHTLTQTNNFFVTHGLGLFLLTLRPLFLGCPKIKYSLTDIVSSYNN